MYFGTESISSSPTPKTMGISPSRNIFEEKKNSGQQINALAGLVKVHWQCMLHLTML